jgi:hypothetical protein
MQRLARRSWDNAVPHAIRDSAPALPPGASPPIPGAPVYTRPASSPAIVEPRELSPSLDTNRDDSIRALLPPRPRVWPWIVVGLLGFIGGIVVIVTVAAGGDKGPPGIKTSPADHVMQVVAPPPPPPTPPPAVVKDQAPVDDGSAAHVAEATHEAIVPEVDPKKNPVKQRPAQTTHVKAPDIVKVDDAATKDKTVEVKPDDKQIVVPCDPTAKPGIRGDNDPCAPKHPNR